MSKKNIMIICIILIIITIIISLLLKKKDIQEKEGINEIVPEEEISEEQERKTMITLYFENSETKELSKEARIIDVKELAKNPYKVLIEKLIEGPKSDKLNKLIPENTKLNNIYMQGDIIYVDFTKEFVENCEKGLEHENKVIYSVVNTLTELNEVTYVKILIDGEENKEFKDKEMNFIDYFEKND